IRVLDLEPASSPNAGLCAALRLVRLADQPTYEAISYTWGQSVFPERLHIGGSHLPITENLAEALRHFRARSENRTLWADSVCINQQDNNEKSHQVGMMADIYKIARNVLVWL
ncbi:HET-domain-containing protein, partial [Zopfia rhizophila CBS 207.26]